MATYNDRQKFRHVSLFLDCLVYNVHVSLPLSILFLPRVYKKVTSFLPGVNITVSNFFATLFRGKGENFK